MNTKDQVLVKLGEFQKDFPPEVPVLIIVALPETQEFIKLANGLQSPANRLHFMHATAEFLLQQVPVTAAPMANPDGDAVLFTLPVGKECPLCLGLGGGSDPESARCGMCGGTGRIKAS